MSSSRKVNVALVGLGKMGVSHLAIANASQRLELSAVCDSFTLLGQMVEKHCNIPYVADYAELIARPGLEAVIIATPTRFHDEMVRAALQRGLHVFCEKPMTLTGAVGAIGRVRHVHAEAYGPVVLKPAAKTWRSQSNQGGGCLYDYAAHPINLMNWYVGSPLQCIGSELAKQYSLEVDDAVYANLRFGNEVTGQVSVNWSDETMRKMTTRISIWGDGGKIVADRQELQVYVGASGKAPVGYNNGWTVRYITELTPPVDYYLRGEEYSAQLEGFATAVAERNVACVNDFRSAAETDVTLEMIRARAMAEPPPADARTAQRRGVFARVLGR
jgi:scyllo-inositol 2-dehydrogenase (NADP+)